MPLKIANGEKSTHPITELDYPLRRERFEFGAKTIHIECLDNVENAIDLVFQWLQSKGKPADEIEHLAPYFGTVWASALALAEWVSLEGESQGLTGKTLLELGCGLALPGFVATKCEALVTLSDGHPDVIRFLEGNIALNGDPDIKCLIPDWTSGRLPALQYDYVIASDVLYESHHPKLFSRVMTAHVKQGGKIVLVDPGRSNIQSFITEMNRLGWQENFTPSSVCHKGHAVEVFLFAFEQNT